MAMGKFLCLSELRCSESVSEDCTDTHKVFIKYLGGSWEQSLTDGSVAALLFRTARI